MPTRMLLGPWLLLVLAPLPARAQEPSLQTAPAQAPASEIREVTPERARAAWEDVLELCSEVGLEREHAPELELVSRARLRKVLNDELLPQMRNLHPGDEPTAAAQARQAATSWSRMALAKFSWSRKSVLLCAANWEANARLLGRPDLSSDEMLRVVLLHELVHAADARVHGFHETLETRTSDDELRALDAVIEGNAQRVTRKLCARRGWEQAFTDFVAAIGALPPSDEGQPAMDLILRITSAQMRTGYVQGEAFMQAVEAARGAEGIREAFARPPRDMGQIFHPGWYLDPATRPPLLHDLEAGLEVLQQLEREEEWISRRQTLTPAVLLASLGDLAQEDIDRTLRTLRMARVLVLQPSAQPSQRMAALGLMVFETPEDALAFVAVEERVTRRKDEVMTRGDIRVLSATYEPLEHGAGFTCHKTMALDDVEQPLWMVVAARGNLVAELVFSVESIGLEAMAALAVRALEAATPAPPKGE